MPGNPFGSGDARVWVVAGEAPAAAGVEDWGWEELLAWEDEEVVAGMLGAPGWGPAWACMAGRGIAHGKG